MSFEVKYLDPALEYERNESRIRAIRANEICGHCIHSHAPSEDGFMKAYDDVCWCDINEFFVASNEPIDDCEWFK